MKNIIEIKNLHKSFGIEDILGKINLDIKENEFLTILGPSGCGKTTLLRIIAGFETATSGNILFGGKDLLIFPPHKRNINTVFQSYALFPHMNVEENIAFALKIKKENKDIIKEKVTKMLNLVNLNGFEKRRVRQLSGGQQQRVAIARALINEPKVLLLDEPLGALDLKLRKEMQIELKNMQKSLGITFIYVTHDQEEALTMSDTIVVMNKGEILQKGTAEDIYNEPLSAFVADFIGTSNILPGQMEKDFEVYIQGVKFHCIDKMPDTKDVDVVIRPEDVEISKNADKFPLKGEVINVVFFGVHYEMIVKVEDTLWKVHSTVMTKPGEIVGIDVSKELIHIMRR
ncbi:MAG: ABC transporter ATP-binding protein [Defluviitaleaceae bacterium]|nr:ABC transporter ATP-binding protein [Defluviitaleaceae bacterium]